MNEKIYQNNLYLFKKTHNMRGNLDCVVDVNNILRRSNYGFGGYYIRRTGKRYIAAYLASRIKQREHQQTVSGTDISTQNNITKEDGISKVAENENRKSGSYTKKTETYENLAEEMGIHKNTFLYPRLSQVASTN